MTDPATTATAPGEDAAHPPAERLAAAQRPLWDLVRPVRGPLAVAVVCDVMAALAGVLPYIAIVEIARSMLTDPADTGRAWAWVWIAAGGLLVRLVALFVAMVVTHLADAELAASLRTRISRHLGVLPLGWFGRNAAGKVKKIAQDDVAALHHMVAHAVVDLTTAIVVPVATLAYLVAVDWRMAVAALVPLLAAVALYAVALGGSMEMYDRYDSSLADINAAMVEYAGGIAVVKAFGRVGQAHGEFATACGRFARFFGEWMGKAARTGTAVEVVSAPPVALLLLVVTGAGLVAGGAPPITVLAGIVLGLGISAPVYALGAGFQKIREASMAAERVHELLAVPAIPQPAEPHAPSGTVVALENVTFSYGQDDDAVVPVGGLADRAGHGERESAAAAVSGIDLVLEPGTVTALVGASGSGKSTLGRLVPRFYDPQEGRVTLGGVDLRELAQEDLYRHIGFVFQDDYLLDVSLRDNIALARPDASDEEVMAAAGHAQIADRIAETPHGLDSVLGAQIQLSGGERQRVAIARALLADTPILVLDEATAFADPDSEAAIQDALSTLAVGRTVLVIAHRLHTIVNADQIVVMEAGRIVEKGRHADLLTAGGLYARLWHAYGGGGSPGSPAEQTTVGLETRATTGGVA